MRSGNDSAKLNKLRSAKRKMFVMLKGVGFKVIKHKPAIREFAKLLGQEAKPNPNDWLISLWDSGEHEFVQRSDAGFYLSNEWITLRKTVLKKHGRVCMKCGSTENIHVDHIKPRSLYREMEIDADNLQALCASCN